MLWPSNTNSPGHGYIDSLLDDRRQHSGNPSGLQMTVKYTDSQGLSRCTGGKDLKGSEHYPRRPPSWKLSKLVYWKLIPNIFGEPPKRLQRVPGDPAHIQIYIYTYTHLYTYIHIYMYTCIPIYIYISKYRYTYIYFFGGEGVFPSQANCLVIPGLPNVFQKCERSIADESSVKPKLFFVGQLRPTMTWMTRNLWIPIGWTMPTSSLSCNFWQDSNDWTQSALWKIS